MKQAEFQPGRTAISRTDISAPLKYLLLSNRIHHTDDVLDFGCGYGFDVKSLECRQSGLVKGYDPYHEPFTKMPKQTFNVVLLTYVLNVIHEQDQFDCLMEVYLHMRFSESLCYISVRRDIERGVSTFRHADGTYHIQRFVELPHEFFTLLYDNRRYAIYYATANSLGLYLSSLEIF